MSTTSNKSLLVPFIAILFPAIAALRTISLPDFWMHIAQGQAGILRAETFSITSEGVKFVDAHWLYNLLVTALFNGGGAAAVTLLHVIAVIAGFTLLILAARRYTSGFPVAFAVVISTWLMLAKLDARPILLAMPFIALMIFALENRVGGVKEWVLIGVGQWFWMGFHPSFLLGPLLCAVYGFSRSREPGGTPGDVKQGLIGAGVALGVSLLNPYGPALHLWAFSNLPLTYMPISLTNLSSVSDAMGADWFRLALYAALAIGGGGLLTYKEKLPLAITATAVAAAFMAVMAVGRISYHLLAIFGFLFFTISCKALGDFISSHFEKESPIVGIAGSAALAVAILASLVPLATGGFFQSLGSPSRLGLGLTQQVVTDGAINFLRSEGFPETLVNMPIDGGKLKAKIPSRKIFIDQRISVYPNTLFTDINKALVRGDRETWDTLVERYDPDAVLVNLSIRGSQNGVRMLLEKKEWKLTYFDGLSAVLVLNKPEWTAFTTNTDAQTKGLTQLDQAKNKTLSSLTRGKLPPLPLQLTGGGNLLLSLDRYPQANLLLELAFASAPSDTELLHQVAISRFNIQDLDRAQKALNEVVTREPENTISWLWLARTYEAQDRQADAATAFGKAYALNAELADQIKKVWQLKSGV